MLITNVRIVSNDTETGILENGAIYVKDDEIVEIGPTEVLEKRYCNVKDIIHGKGMTVLPGLVNAYVNMESAIFPKFGVEERFGIPENDLYKRIHEALQSIFDEEIFFTITEKIAHDSLKQGVTTVAGSIERYLHKIEVSKTIEAVMNSMPFRFIVGESLKNPEDLQRLIKSGEKPQYIPLNSITSFDDDSLRNLKEFSENINAFVVILLSDESREEKETFLKYGMSNLERLRHLNLLGDHEIIVNAQHFTETDLDIMASTDTMAVYSPRQMMIQSMGLPDIDGMMGRGVNVSIGTGNISDLSILGESQVAFLLRRMIKGTTDFAAVYQIKKILLENNYHFAGKLLDKPIGKLASGYIADFVLYDYNGPIGEGKKPTLRNLLFDFLRDARVYMAVVNGRIAYDSISDDRSDLEERIKEIRHKVLSRV